MIQPIIHDYLTQIFCRHYGYEPDPAAEAALKFIDLLELYRMELIVGEWVVPETITIIQKPLTGWDRFLATIEEVEESGRKPWLAEEIQ